MTEPSDLNKFMKLAMLHISHVWKGLLFTLCTLKFSIWNKNKITYSNFSVLFIIDYDVIESQWWITVS